MQDSKKSLSKNGRPELHEGKKSCFIRARLTEDEYQQLLQIEKELGLNHTQLIRRKLLENTGQILLNSRAVLRQLDKIGAELGRSGNNLNQLARHANILNLQGRLDGETVAEFNKLMTAYIQVRHQTEESLRSLIRLIRS